MLSWKNSIFPLDLLFFVISAALKFCKYSFSNYSKRSSKIFYRKRFIGDEERKRTLNSKEGREKSYSGTLKDERYWKKITRKTTRSALKNITRNTGN